MPVAATRHTPDGAKAFAEFFIKTIDWGFATMNPTYMRHYFRESCDGCSSFARTIDEDRRSGHRYVGGRLTVQRVVLESAGQELERVTVVVDGTSREVVTSTGKFVNGDPAYPGLKLSVTISWGDEAWRTTGLAVRT